MPKRDDSAIQADLNKVQGKIEAYCQARNKAEQEIGTINGSLKRVPEDDIRKRLLIKKQYEKSCADRQTAEDKIKKLRKKEATLMEEFYS